METLKRECPESIKCRRFLSRISNRNEFRFVSYNILSPHLVATEKVYQGLNPLILDWNNRKARIEE